VWVVSIIFIRAGNATVAVRVAERRDIFRVKTNYFSETEGKCVRKLARREPD